MNEQGTAPVGQPDNLPVGDLGNGQADKLPRQTVLYETHEKLLNERKRDLARLKDFEAKEKEREEADARKRGDYENLIKARDEALKAKDEELNGIRDMIHRASKKNAVIEALGGNIDSKWLKLIDVSDVAVNPETGEVDNFTVAKVAESFKKEFPEAIKKHGYLPANAPQGLQGGDGKISRAEWLKLSHKDMVKWKPHQIVE